MNYIEKLNKLKKEGKIPLLITFFGRYLYFCLIKNLETTKAKKQFNI